MYKPDEAAEDDDEDDEDEERARRHADDDRELLLGQHGVGPGVGGGEGDALYCTVLYCTVLHCTVLYCTVLDCTVLYCHLQQRARELVRGHQLVAAHTAGVGKGLLTNY